MCVRVNGVNVCRSEVSGSVCTCMNSVWSEARGYM